MALKDLEITANILDEHILMIDEALLRLEADDHPEETVCFAALRILEPAGSGSGFDRS